MEPMTAFARHPPDPPLPDLERAVDALARGEPGAMDEVFRLAYGDLQQIARSRLRRWRPSQTLNTTALVHEAYLRARGRGDDAGWASARHFLAFSAKAMRHILVDHVRRREATCRASGLLHMTLDEETLAVQGTEAHQRLDLLALDEAMKKLGALDPRLERLVELRYFAGCSMPEVSKQLGVSLRTVERDWTRSRAYLRMLLEEEADTRDTPANPGERTDG